MHERIDRRVGRPATIAPRNADRRARYLAPPRLEEGPVDVLGIDVATLVVAELGGEEGELAVGSATGERLIGDDHETIDIAVGEAVPFGQRTGHDHGEHLVVGSRASAQRSMASRWYCCTIPPGRQDHGRRCHRESPRPCPIAQRSPGGVS